MKKYLFKIFILYFFISCNSGNYFIEFKDLNDGWEYKSPVIFNFFAPQEPVDISLMIRVDKSYPFSNIFIKSKIMYEENVIIDTLELDLTKNEKGIFSGNSLSLQNHNFLIAKKVNLSKDVTFEVSHASRFLDSINAVKKLNGILSVGLLVEKYQNEKI
jgi:gliding motility-associated lipoprotein GldH